VFGGHSKKLPCDAETRSKIKTARRLWSSLVDSYRRFESMRSTLLQANPFYRSRLARNPAFSDLPFTSKDEIIQDQSNHPPFGTNLTYPVETYVRMHQTSGTAGRPMLWLDTPESWDWFLRCWEEVYRSAGVRTGDTVYVAFS